MKACATLPWLLIHGLVLLGIAIPSAGAGIQEASTDFSSKAWTMLEGLPDNRIHDIAQTRDGYLWLGTRKGLARFDGLKFTVFNQANTPAMTTEKCWLLAEDGEGRLWIGTPNGLLCYFEGTWIRYSTQEGLSNNFVDSLCPARGGGIWMGAFRGLNRFDGKRWQSYHASRPDIENDQRSRDEDRVTALHEDRHGRLWVGTARGLSRFEVETGKFLSDFPAQEHPDDSVRAIHMDSEGSLWVAHWRYGSQHGFLSVLKDGKWIQHPEGFAFADGKTLLASCNQGARFWVPSDRWAIERLTDPVSKGLLLPLAGGSDPVYSALEDREGNLWLGTQESGLHCWRPGANAIRTLSHGMVDPNSWAVCQDTEGRVWVGTDYGIARFTGNDLTLLSREDGLADYRVRSLALDSQGNVLIGTLSGLHVFEKGALRLIPTPGGETEHRIRAILCGNGGLLWLGTDGGALRLQDGEWTAFTITNGLVDNRVRGLFATRDGAVWIGTPRGLCCFRNGELRTFTVRDGLSSPFAYALLEDSEGRLWIGTDAGLDLHEGGRILPVNWREGLIDGRVNSILQDRAGYYWIASGRGIFRAEEKQLPAAANGRSQEVRPAAFGEADGILSSDTNGQESQPAGCKTRDGRLWFATRAGVVVIDPAKLNSEEVAPSVVIERIRSNDRILFSNEPLKREVEGLRSPESAAFISGPVDPTGMPSQLQLPPGAGRLMEFQFTANSLTAPERVRFKCCLDGREGDWVDLGSRRVASYANLRPGSYRFRVIACNAHEVWNETGASFAFHVEPFFHQTWWFRALGFVLAGAVIASALLWRARAARRFRAERQDALSFERARIDKDLHDGLGPILTTISNIAQAAQDSGESNSDHLRKISDSTREAVHTLREIIWVSNPGDETLDGLTAAICQKAEEFLAEAGVRRRFDLPEEFPRIPVSLEQRWNLLLTAKEALNNVAKHAAASEVRIRASVAETDFILSIEDNGRGFDLNSQPLTSNPQPRPGGHGLTIMRERVEGLGGRFELESSAAGGTKIRIQIPLKEYTDDRHSFRHQGQHRRR